MIQKGERSGLQLPNEHSWLCSEHFVSGQNSLPPDYAVTCQAQRRENELKISADMRDGLLGKGKAMKTVTD